MGESLGTAVLLLRADATGLYRDMAVTERGVVARTRAMSAKAKAASVGLLAVGAAAALGAKSAVNAYAEFDAAMTESLAIMGDVSKTQRNEMVNAARAVGRETTFSATQAAESYFYLASAGLDAAASVKAMPQVAKFAQAGMFDMARATDLVTDAQSALGLAVRDNADKNLKNMTRVTDVLVKANTLANASVEQFSVALTTKAGAAARNYGKDIEETTAVLAAFADQGVKGELAGNALNIVWRDLQTANRKNRDEWEKLGVSVFDSNGKMRNTADIVGDLEKALAGMSNEQSGATLASLGFQDRSVSFLRTLLGTSDGIKNYEKELRNAKDTTDEIANKQLQSLNRQWDLFKGKVNDAQIALGEKLEPTVRTVVEGLNQLATEMMNGTGTGGEMVRIVQDIGRSLISLATFAWQTGRALHNIGATSVIVGAMIGMMTGRMIAFLATLAIAKVGAFVAALRSFYVTLQIINLAIMQGGLRALPGLFAAGGASMTAMLGPIGLLVGALGGAIYAVSVLRNRNRENTSQQDRHAAAIDRVRAAQNRLKDAQLDSKDADIAWRQSRIETQRALEQYNEAVAKHGKRSREAREANLNLESATNRQKRAYREMRRTTDDAAVAANNAKNKNAELATSTAQPIQKFHDLRDILRFVGKQHTDFPGKVGPVKRANNQMKSNVQNLGDAWTQFGGHFGSTTDNALTKMGAKPLGFNFGRFDVGGAEKKATGGFLGGAGKRDTVPIWAAPGEAIVNRHQQEPINYALQQTFGIDLPGLFSAISTPHYMARGGNIGAVGSAGKKVLTKQARKYLKEQFEKVSSRGAGGGGGTGASGLVPQVRRALSHAKKSGWGGSVVSGFRSSEKQAQLYQMYLNGTGNLAAPPGSSSHEKGEAVDVSATEQFAAAMSSAPDNSRLYRKVPGEPWHFSVTGHARGGFVGGVAKAKSRKPRRVTSKTRPPGMPSGVTDFTKIWERKYPETVQLYENLRRGLEQTPVPEGMVEFGGNLDAGELDTLIFRQQEILDMLVGRVTQAAEAARKQLDEAIKRVEAIVEAITAEIKRIDKQIKSLSGGKKSKKKTAALNKLRGRRTKALGRRNNAMERLREFRTERTDINDRLTNYSASNSIVQAIDDAKYNLSQLTGERANPSAAAGGRAADDGGLSDMLRQQRDAAYSDINLLQQQLPVFQRFFPFAGVFHDGGTVPGPPGREYMALVRGQEKISTPEQQRADQAVTVVIEDGAVDAGYIRVVASDEFDRKITRAVKSSSRGPVVGRKARV